ncbi:MAG: flagellar biosynthetic protein FliO [Alishewanella agri]|nr:flagellar biosynthetic protein FliO [Alishewanella agri]
MLKLVAKLAFSLLLPLSPIGVAASNQVAAEPSQQTATAAAQSPAEEPVAEPLHTENSRPNRLVSRDAVLNPGSDNSSGSMALGKIVISLALVILLVLGLGWLFKKLTLRLPGSRHMKVICTLPLGQRERILIIEIQGKQRVIGVTPQSINLLFELENPLPEEKLASDFHTQLQSFLKK